jgi:UDP-N-acetylglucosamine--N-acetylmuramyl-(pentapeptide) pyrophosphoryl-undecaprenol N-acetylglucosamine transferase
MTVVPSSSAISECPARLDSGSSLPALPAGLNDAAAHGSAVLERASRGFSDMRSSEKAAKVMIAGGGTGGHLYLGIALARELLSRDARTELVFVGTRYGLESRIVPREGFRLEYIISAGLKGMGLRSIVRNFLLIPRSLLQSRRLIRAQAPEIVVGVGGYSSGPVVLAAWWLGLPTLVIEPNAHPGLTNRWLARVVDRAALALPEATRHFGRKAVITGIPVREEFKDLPDLRQSGRFTLLVYGGSQGSHALNSAMCAALPELAALGSTLQIIHQTGEREFEAVQNSYRDAGVAADVRPFLPRIYEEFSRANLILSRAGASTMAELTVSGRAAILVPFPGAADDHQTKNAQALERAGAARMVPESELRTGRLAREVKAFIEHPEWIAPMEQAARAMAKPDAATKIADLVLELAS